MSRAGWFSVITAKLLPPVVPTKNVDGLEVPPLAAGFTTVTFEVPMLAMSAAVILAVKPVLETKVVGRGLPFQTTVEDWTKFAPVTAMLKAEPP